MNGANKWTSNGQPKRIVAMSKKLIREPLNSTMERETYRMISSQDLSRYANREVEIITTNTILRYANREVEIIPTNSIQSQNSPRYATRESEMVSMNTGVMMVM
ncbi:unnamed protein product [Gordionus sp. m RMFG-2023]